MTKHRAQSILYFLLTFSCLSLLSACQRYSFAINENVVYEPPPLFTAFKIADVSLKNCIEAAIAEQEVRKAIQLKNLSCPPGNIKALTGIEVFSQLEQLGMAQNQISNIEILGQLKELKRLDLRENQVVSFTVLKSLHKLGQVYTKGNATADCATLPDPTKLRIEKPKHCLI